jgi:hypothetical protein
MKALIVVTACAVLDGLVVGVHAFAPIRTSRSKWYSNNASVLPLSVIASNAPLDSSGGVSGTCLAMTTMHNLARTAASHQWCCFVERTGGIRHMSHGSESEVGAKALNSVWIQLYIVGVQVGAADKILVPESSDFDRISELVKLKFNLAGISKAEISLYAPQDKVLGTMLDPGAVYNPDLHGGSSNDCPILANTSKLLMQTRLSTSFSFAKSDSMVLEQHDQSVNQVRWKHDLCHTVCPECSISHISAFQPLTLVNFTQSPTNISLHCTMNQRRRDSVALRDGLN